MSRTTNLLSQLLDEFPRLDFQSLIKKQDAEKGAKGGVKGPLLIDHDDYLPSYVLISEARNHGKFVLR
jgi:hypothetical protein